MAYHVSIDLFEGPLDLLLHLVGEARIDIRDIFVSQIVEQYMEYMADLGAEDMDRASEFLAMAARLLEIKSRRLLPSTTQEELEEVEQEEETLIRQLEQMKLYREACEALAQMGEEAALMHYRMADERYQDERVRVQDMTLEALTKAFLQLKDKLLQAREIQTSVNQVPRDVFTVKEKLLDIRRRLLHGGKVTFTSLFSGQPTREEVVVTFLALLELVKDGYIEARQQDTDGMLTIERRKEAFASHGE